MLDSIVEEASTESQPKSSADTPTASDSLLVIKTDGVKFFIEEGEDLSMQEVQTLLEEGRAVMERSWADPETTAATEEALAQYRDTTPSV